ncbi:DUF7524 family protein [Halocalculus aciditolerans]|uniref:Uncharacterized protein n=1 Tax=Halocalculus aciditolerans TaxID=1383812 RepID=A0A830F2R8_9EURY|nr:hypothetical protein [Halocalculus aciditolerans]GGL56795.1 hypothetical protein GCM10009039_13690 [Halocalculus aciditolerans]
MPGTLTVHFNRGRNESVAVDRDRFEVTGSFTLELVNHGSPAHVHLRLDDALSGVARLDSANEYLDEGETLRVPVIVSAAADDVRGELEVVTQYGREKVSVPVFVDYTSEEAKPVEIDESLGEFQPSEPSRRFSLGRLAPALVVAVGILVTVLAILVADRTVAAMVAVVVLLGSVSAAVFLYRQV